MMFILQATPLFMPLLLLLLVFFIWTFTKVRKGQGPGSKFTRYYIFLTILLTGFVHFVRWYVVIPALRALGRMPTWSDFYAMRRPKEIFFSWFWDEWFFAWAHLLLPLLLLLAAILWVGIRKEKNGMSWAIGLFVIIIAEAAFRYTEAYQYIIAD